MTIRLPKGYVGLGSVAIVVYSYRAYLFYRALRKELINQHSIPYIRWNEEGNLTTDEITGKKIAEAIGENTTNIPY